MSELTRVLQAIAQGDPRATKELLPRVYEELRSLAATRLAAEPTGQTLQATALVHEAYLRLVGSEPQQGWGGAGHFFAAAATAMRRILIDRARHKKREIHGGNRQRHELESDIVPAVEPNEDLLALHAALEKLAEHDAAKAQLVELRYFAGLTGEEAANVLGISAATADRHWAYARAWLRREMEKGGAGEKSPVIP
ncbi:MAG: ECF-type sigma factor [Planctomycetota bacterium]|nr:ECF-type sigma factor [Planctomycetota bacterium]